MCVWTRCAGVQGCLAGLPYAVGCRQAHAGSATGVRGRAVLFTALRRRVFTRTAVLPFVGSDFYICRLSCLSLSIPSRLTTHCVASAVVLWLEYGFPQHAHECGTVVLMVAVEHVDAGCEGHVSNRFLLSQLAGSRMHGPPVGLGLNGIPAGQLRGGSVSQRDLPQYRTNKAHRAAPVMQPRRIFCECIKHARSHVH